MYALHFILFDNLERRKKRKTINWKQKKNKKKMKKWSSQWTQFMQLRKEACKKFRTSTGFEPVTSQLPVRCSTNWAMKPLTLGAGQLWVHMFPWKKWVLNDIWNKSYMNCGNEMKQCLWTVNIAINTITLFLTLKLWRIFNYDLCSDVDDFIVDDEGNPIRQAKKKRRLHGAVHDS